MPDETISNIELDELGLFTTVVSLAAFIWPFRIDSSSFAEDNPQ
jgi:hypothetical protein